jgi:type I restriction enzyme M protein
MSEPITQKEINTIIWKACDTFRGVIDPSSYKDYILTMLFIKYYSDVYSEKYDEYIKKYTNKERAEYAMKHERFIVPETSSFEYLYNHRNDSNI